MTGDNHDPDGLAAIFKDDRARVPFAIIAVLLLVSAVALVGFLETRGSAETDTDPSLAMDQTEAAIHTTLRDATASAAQQAAAEPLTNPANTSYGDALDADRPFMSYFEGLVYLEASERFETAGQRVGDVETNVSLPPVTGGPSFGEAIESVSLAENGSGLLTVELEGIQITAVRDGEQLASRTETIEVSVPTPVVQQHERTEQFQQKLNGSITDIGSFSQRFNARIYGLGWLRGYAQYGGLPVTEVIANRHVQPSANSALYRTQQAVFGAADPSLDSAVRRGWFCMATKDAQGLYNGYKKKNLNVADDVCKAIELLSSEKHTDKFPELPGEDGLLKGIPGRNKNHTIGVNETAYSPLRTLVAGADEHSIEKAIERAFTIDTEIQDNITKSGPPSFDHDKPSPEANATDTQRQQESISVQDGAVESGNPETNGSYYRFSDVEVAVEMTEVRTWEWTENGSTETTTTEANGTLDVALTVTLMENDTAPDLHIDEFNGNLGVEHKYEYGPDTPDDERTVPAPGFRNYADREAGVAEAVVGGKGLQALEEWLGEQWANVTSEDGLDLPESREAVLELDAEQESKLVSTALDDISALQESVEDITHTFNRTDLVHGDGETGPVGKLKGKVETERETYLNRTMAYENVGQQVVYEVRYAYFETLLDDLERIETAHGKVMGGLNSSLNDIDSSLDNAMEFLEAGIDPGGGSGGGGDDPSFDSPAITPEISYEVSGSPTYLAGKPVISDDVPAVEQGTEFSPFAAMNNNYLKLPYKTVIKDILNKLLSFLGRGDPDAELTLRMAGEALRAGELAEEAATADGTYADGDELGGLNDDLEDALDDGLDEFAQEMGIEVVRELYGVKPDDDEPYYSNDTHNTATNKTRDATAATIEAFPSTAEAAIAIGSGNATESLIANISGTLDDDGIERPPYARNLSEGGWRAVVASAVRPALDYAAANATATVDTDLVENLDTATRQALENVSSAILKDRLDSYLANKSFNLGAYEDWVGDGNETDTPVRVPAGLPILPFPTKWVATMNLWDVHADGQYARFEVKANMTAPGRETSTTYVRENMTVERTIAGETRNLGAVEPIAFEGRSLLIVVVPPGGIGVGDRDDENPECTETYPVVGPYDEEDTDCSYLGGG